MRVAITGVSGYIGSMLLPRLEGMVERIIGVDIKPPQNSSPKLKFYRRDILQPLADIFIENKADAAIHLVFILKPTHNENHARRINIGGTLNFLEACKQASVRHIVYLSSYAVYGAHPDNTVPLSEDAPLRPLSDFQYSWDKAKVEQILTDFASLNQVKLTILRSCLVVGPHAKNSAAASLFKPIMLAVSGYDPLIQFIHEDDLANLIATLLSRGQEGVFNVAADGGVRYREVARLAGRRMIALPDKFLCLLMEISWALRLQSQSPSSGLEFIKYPPLLSNEKLKRETGFEFTYSSRDALLSFLKI